MSRNKKIKAIHPGEILNLDFLLPLKITQYRLAKSINVPPRRINEIVKWERAITADTALRLGRYFGTSPEFWLNLQSKYELEIEEEKIGESLLDDVMIFNAFAV